MAGRDRGIPVIVPRRVLVKSENPNPVSFYHGLHNGLHPKVPLSKDPAHSQEPPWCRFGTEVLRHTSNLLKEFPTSGNVGEEQVNGCFLGYGNNTIWNSTYLFGKWWSFSNWIAWIFFRVANLRKIQKLSKITCQRSISKLLKKNEGRTNKSIYTNTNIYKPYLFGGSWQTWKSSSWKTKLQIPFGLLRRLGRILLNAYTL